MSGISKYVTYSVLGIMAISLGLFSISRTNDVRSVAAQIAATLENPVGYAAAAVSSSFSYQFKIDGVLTEAGSMSESWSPYWWVNSGAQMVLKNGVGKTLQGTLPTANKW